MKYTLPKEVNSVQELDFPNPVCPIKNPTGQRGFMIPTKNMNPTLGIKVKKWGAGGVSRSTPKVKKYLHDQRDFKP